MKKLITGIIFLSSLSAFADSLEIDACTKKISSAPYCVTLANSSSYCKQMGGDVKAANMVTGCLDKMLRVYDLKNATLLCLSKYVESSNEDENKSLCNEDNEFTTNVYSSLYETELPMSFKKL